MKTKIFALAALVLSLAACTQDELADDNRLPEGEYPVVIRATGLSVETTPLAAPSTRATVDGDWQGVQTVALKMGDAVKEYTVTASIDFKSATLSRENAPHYWTSRAPITVSAWWPFDNADIAQMPAVKVAEDQSKLADFQNSDFISAENRQVEFNNPTLEFNHRTARVAIELKPGTGFTSVDGATVSLVSLSADNGNPTAIKTYNASGNTYEALTAPQTVAAGKPFVKVELGGGTFYFRPQNNVVLEAGNRYTYTVRVNATGLTLEGCTIGDWADGGGESGEAEDLGYSIQGDGSYTVTSADGLINVAELVNGGKTDINITLGKNIDLTGKGWTPIGTNYENSYKGTFDGGGHTITGLTVTTNDQFVGLFGYLYRDGTVKNVVMEGIQITSNHMLGLGFGCTGGVVGYNWGTVENCSVSGSVSGTECVGGVVGRQTSSGSIIGCSSSATVKGMRYVGGVAGEQWGTMTACYATGNVTLEIGSQNNLSGGGVVGLSGGNRVLACYATGNVNSKGSSTGNVHIGGLLGDNYTAVTACYWKNNQEQGFGSNQHSTAPEATKVDGTTVKWQAAVDGMNTALQNAGSEWRYELNGTLPTLRKQ